MDVQFGPNSVDDQSLLYKLQRKYKVFDTVNPLSNRCYCLVASASKYGLVFIASPEGVLSVYYLKDLIDKDCDPQHLSLKLQEKPTHIAVSCDHELLAITGGQVLWIYKIVNFQNQNTSPSASIKCDVNLSTFVCALQWNPCIPDTIAVAFFDGTLLVSHVNTVQVKKIQSNARCICWSPKGKQLVVGNNDGTLCQYKPDLSPMKLVAAPNLFNGAPVEALAIYWIATYQFAVVYRNASDNSRPAVTIVNTPKAGQPSCINYEDICYSQGSNRPWYYFLQGIAQWNLILSSSSNSMEIATLASNDGANWLQWCQTDEARPELPLSDKKQENFPVGVCIDTCAIHQLPWGENETLPHMPLLHVVSQTGLLTTFNIINLNQQAPQICTPPQQLVLPASMMISSVPAVITPPPSALMSAPIQTSTPVPQPLPALQPALSAFQPTVTPQVTSSTFYSSYQTPAVQPLTTAANTSNQLTDQKPQIEVKQAPKLQPPVTTKTLVQPPVQESTPQIKDVAPEQKVDLETINRNKEIKLRSMLIKEVNDFQMELYNFMVKTREMQIQHQNDLNSIDADFNIQSLDPEKLKKECSLEELRSAVIQLKLELVRACAVVAEARTQSEAKDLYQWSQADPLTTKRVTSVKKLAYYVQTQLEQAQKALDYKWNELATREPQFTKPGQRMIRPILDDVYQPLVKQQEILSRQQAVLRTLRNTLKECDATPMFKSTSLLRSTPFRNKDPLSKLTKNILNMSIETQTNSEKQPLLSHKKLDALKDVLSNHKTVKIKPVNMELRKHLTDMKLKYERSMAEKAELESNMQNVSVKTEPNVEPVKIAQPINKVKIEPKHELKNEIKLEPIEPSLEPVTKPTIPSLAPIPVPNNVNANQNQNVVRTLFTDEPKKDQMITPKEQLPPQIPQSNLASKQQAQPITPPSKTVDTRNVLKDLLQNRTQISVENKNDANTFMGQNICSPSAFNFAAPQQTTSSMPSILFAPKPISDTTNVFGKIQTLTFTSEPKDQTTVPIKSKLQTPIEAPQNKVVEMKPKVEKPITNLFALKPTIPTTANTQNVNVFRGITQEDNKVLAKTGEKTKENFSIKEISSDKKEISKENIPKSTNKSLGLTESPGPTNEMKNTTEITIDNAKTGQKSESSASSIFASANPSSLTAPKSQSIFGMTSPQASSPTSIFGSPNKESETTSVTSNTVTATTVSASSLFAKAVASQPSLESGASPTTTTPETPPISSILTESMVKTTTPVVSTENKQTIFSTPKPTTPVSVFGTATTQSVFGSSVTQASVLATNISEGSQSSTPVTSETSSDTPATTNQNIFKAAISPTQKETVFGTTSSSIFGTVTPTTQTSLFGTLPSSQPSLFTSTTPTTQVSVFGATTTQSTFGNQTSVFGAPSKTTQSSIFGTTSETTPASIFGTQTQTTQASIFSGTTQATSTPVFGSSQTAPSSVFGTTTPKNQVPTFGSQSPQASIFGTAQTTQPTLFGSPTQTTQASIFGTPTQVSQTSVFGTPSPTTQVSVFGTPPATTTQTTSLFGGAESNIFAAASISATKPASPTSGGNIFGGSSPGSVFGGSNSNVFGGKSTFGQSNPTTASIFGGGATFGQKQGSNLWGSGNASSGTGFGSGFAQQATTQASIFGGSSGGSFSAPSTGQAFGSSQPGPFSGGDSSSSVFGTTQQSTSPTFGGSPAFGSQPVFGQSSSAFSSGFNKSPSSGGFGAPASFGSGATFGGSAFGSPSKVFGGSSPGFGAPTQSNSTFENLATQNTLTFGNLAQQSPQQQQQAAPSFNTSPSFTGWRG